MKQLRRLWQDLPLGHKIAAFASVLVLLIVLTVTVMTMQPVRTSLSAELEAQAHLSLDTYAERLGNSLYLGRIDQIQDIAAATSGRPEITRFRVYDKNWTLLVDASQPGIYHPADSDPARPEPRAGVWADPVLEWRPHELLATEPVQMGEDQIGFVQVGFSTRPLDEGIANLTMQSITFAVAALAIGILLATLVARQLTNPIRELTHTANRMAAGDLSTRLLPEGRSEIEQLARAFNEMASAIEKRETDLRDQAHGLEQAVAQRTGELQKQNQYLGALHEVTLGLIENLDVDRLLEAITIRAATLANTDHAFVTVVDTERGERQVRVAKGNYQSQLGLWTKADEGLVGNVVASGEVKIQDDYQKFEEKLPGFEWLRTSIYVPLRSETATVGVIGLGYDRMVHVEIQDVATLAQFAVLASLALKNARLYGAAQQELVERKRMEAVMSEYEDRLEVTVEERPQELTEANRKLQQEMLERERTQVALRAEAERLEAYRNSPQGRAETARDKLLESPDLALLALHGLAQQADAEPIAAMFSRLPGVLEAAGQSMLATLAEGYDFVCRSATEPELLAVGLRHLVSGLAMQEAQSLEFAADAAKLYGICQQAIDATSVSTITALRTRLQAIKEPTGNDVRFGDLCGALKILAAAEGSLRAYERVDSMQDRRAYLVGAVERLTHASRVAQALQAADQPVVRRIIEKWLAIVTGSMSDIQTRAQMTFRLLTKHTWQEDVITLALRLRNEGQGMALNVRLKLVESPDYDRIDEAAVIERLATGEEGQMELRVRPRAGLESTQLRARFVIMYDDPRGPEQIEHFADVVQLLGPPPTFRFIPNPYVAGTPLEAGSPLFFGREDVFGFIDENLQAAHRNNLVLIGQRRTGKSSLLRQLPLRLGDEYVPVYLDGQSIVLEPGLPAFFLNVATEIDLALKDRGFVIGTPELHMFSERPTHGFEHDYLRRVRAAIGSRQLVLLLDEFEELETAVMAGHLDASVFGFLRHLIQHEPGLCVIFCGTHRMEELATNYWSVLFNISLYKHVGFLEFEEASRLVQEPVAAYGMRYDDLALYKMWQTTAGHPYFLQLLCHSVVNQHNRTGRSYVTISDVNSALDDILASGEAHFVYLWNESSLAERLVLTALSRMMALTGHVTPVQVEDYLTEHGISLDRRNLTEVLRHLELREILAMQVENATAGIMNSYRWRLGLLGLWAEKYKSLSLLQEEARR